MKTDLATNRLGSVWEQREGAGREGAERQGPPRIASGDAGAEHAHREACVLCPVFQSAEVTLHLKDKSLQGGRPLYLPENLQSRALFKVDG